MADATHSLPARARGGGRKGQSPLAVSMVLPTNVGGFLVPKRRRGCFLLEKLKSMGCKLCLKVFTFFNLSTSSTISEVQLHRDAQPQRREVVREQKVASGLLHCWWCCVSTEGSKNRFPMLDALALASASGGVTMHLRPRPSGYSSNNTA